MYHQPRYQKEDPEFIFDFINKNPFATFVLQQENLLATHIPVLPEGSPGNFRLFGHIAHNNEQFGHVKDEIEALLIFQGAQAYISSSWYKETDISTWNYSAVHINARLKLQTKEELENSLEKLVYRFEKEQETPLFYKNLPKKMLDDHLPLIKGIWFEPYKVQAIAKLSQGQEKDVPDILHQLSKNPNNSTLCSNMKKEHSR